MATPTSSPYRATSVRHDDSRWRAASRGAGLYVGATVIRIATVTATAITLSLTPYSPGSVRIALLVSSAVFAVTGVFMIAACVSFARLPRSWSGGLLPSLAALVCSASVAIDVVNLGALRRFDLSRTPAELSLLADAWSDLHRLSALLVAGQSLLLLIPMARIADGLEETVLAHRAKLFALYLPIAVVTIGAMLHLGYGPTSIIVPAALPVGGPFGIVSLALLVVFASLLVRLRAAMSRTSVSTDEPP
jgi:hypothetical protein